MSKPSNLSLLGQIMFVLKAHPEGIWVMQIARQCSITQNRAHYWIFGRMINTGKLGPHRVPKNRLEPQIYVVRTEGNNKLIALKKEGKP